MSVNCDVREGDEREYLITFEVSTLSTHSDGRRGKNRANINVSAHRIRPLIASINSTKFGLFLNSSNPNVAIGIRILRYLMR